MGHRNGWDRTASDVDWLAAQARKIDAERTERKRRETYQRTTRGPSWPWSSQDRPAAAAGSRRRELVALLGRGAIIATLCAFLGGLILGLTGRMSPILTLSSLLSSLASFVGVGLLGVMVGALVVFAGAGLLARGDVRFACVCSAVFWCVFVFASSGAACWFFVSSYGADGAALREPLYMFQPGWIARQPIVLLAVLGWQVVSLIAGMALVRWHLPVMLGARARRLKGAMLAALAVAASMAGSMVAARFQLTGSGISWTGSVGHVPILFILVYCLGGALILGFFTRATDPVRGSRAPFARIYGVLCAGLLVSAGLAWLIEWQHAGLIPMGRATAQWIASDQAPFQLAQGAPRMTSALPSFLLVLAPGFIAVAAALALGLGASYRGARGMARSIAIAGASPAVALAAILGCVSLPGLDAPRNATAHASAREAPPPARPRPRGPEVGRGRTSEPLRVGGRRAAAASPR
jgi:hypothetical protein